MREKKLKQLKNMFKVKQKKNAIYKEEISTNQ